MFLRNRAVTKYIRNVWYIFFRWQFVNIFTSNYFSFQWKKNRPACCNWANIYCAIFFVKLCFIKIKGITMKIIICYNLFCRIVLQGKSGVRIKKWEWSKAWEFAKNVKLNSKMFTFYKRRIIYNAIKGLDNWWFFQ